MMLDRTKLACWVLAIAGIGAAYLAMHEQPAPRPEPPPIHVTIPPPPPVVAPPAPGVVEPVQSAKPPVKVHVRVAKPKPVEPKKKSVPEVKPKPVVHAPHKKHGPNCSLVPPEAYTHAEWLVIQTARSRGVPEEGIVKLRACLAAHAEH